MEGLQARGNRALAEASNLVGYKNAQQPFATSMCKRTVQIILKEHGCLRTLATNTSIAENLI